VCAFAAVPLAGTDSRVARPACAGRIGGVTALGPGRRGACAGRRLAARSPGCRAGRTERAGGTGGC